jgi:hypothetical protein
VTALGILKWHSGGAEEGGGVQAGPTPHSEEVGEGPGLTVRRRAAGNDPTAVRASGARVGGTQTGEDGALTCGPGHCGGF